MYEDQTYEEILDRSLDRVSTDVDKREGSLIMNALAPSAMEHSNLYILLDGILQNGYADTAIREFLILRCRERGITPDEATKAVLKGDFNMEVPIGSRFNLGELNYVVTVFISNTEDTYSYQLECETYGTEGNKYFGELSQIDYISSDLSGSLTELLIPAEDEEETEHLRARYFSSFDSSSFGGNSQDYKTKTDALDGVGGTKVIPVWAGGGTVKLIIINSEYTTASDTLVETVQEAIDPTQDGNGVGIAPIGHIVTVVSVIPVTVNIVVTITFQDGYTWENKHEEITQAVEDYLLEVRKNWEDDEVSTVRVSQVENRILNLEGVLDVRNTTINGVADNLILEVNEIPLLGGITNG